MQTQEQDPTNLYIANLPIHYNEQMLENVLSTYGQVISTRVLRNADGQSRGVGFARMDSKEKCEEIIEALNGRRLPEMKETLPPLLVKQADTGRKTSRKGRGDMSFDMGMFQPQQPTYIPQEYLRGMGGMPHMYGPQFVNYTMGYQQVAAGYREFSIRD